MDFFEAVAKRGSYREEFLPDAIPQSDLDKILTAGLCAPSGYNNQTTTFVVVNDATLRGRIAEILPTKAVKTAPVILVALSQLQTSDKGLSFEIEDYAAATENIMLAITALGYAGVWMDGMVKLDDNTAKLRKLLNIPADRHIRTIIPLGRPALPVVQKPKKTLAERVTYNRF